MALPVMDFSVLDGRVFGPWTMTGRGLNGPEVWIPPPLSLAGGRCHRDSGQTRGPWTGFRIHAPELSIFACTGSSGILAPRRGRDARSGARAGHFRPRRNWRANGIHDPMLAQFWQLGRPGMRGADFALAFWPLWTGIAA